MDINYVTPLYALKRFGVSRTTLAKLANDGKIRSIRTQGETGQHRYCIQDLQNHFLSVNPRPIEKPSSTLVSPLPNKRKMETSIVKSKRSKDYCPSYDQIIKDIGSKKKKNLRSLVINDSSPFVQEFSYLKDCSYDIRDDAVKAFLTSLEGKLHKDERKTNREVQDAI